MNDRWRRRPKPWRHTRKGFSVARLNRQIGAWAAYLGLADWNVAFSTAKVDKDARSSVSAAPLVKAAAIRIDSRVPPEQMDRQIVHELLHVMFSGMEDAFDRAVDLLPKKTRAIHNSAWKRGDEWVIERLTDLISGIPRTEWSSDEVWRAAYPPK